MVKQMSIIPIKKKWLHFSYSIFSHYAKRFNWSEAFSL